MDWTTGIRAYFDREIETINRLSLEEINAAMNALTDARNRGATIWTMGNGGSAATASHFVCDFSKGLSQALGGRKYDLRCLSDNIPIVTAIANDIGYEDVFLYQIHGLIRPDDLLIAISGSGNSPNVIKAVEYAKQIGAKVIGLTGYDGGKLRALADYPLHVPQDDMQITEDIHMMFDHLMMKVLGSTVSA
jgi:D-sedoheptulose 7-phosphate isomerase